MKKLIRTIDALVDSISVLLLVLVVGVVLLQIIFRFFILKPLSWSEELSRYLFIWIVYIGGYLCTKSNSHLGITFFVDASPKKLSKLMTFVANLSIIIYMLIVIFYGFQLSVKVMRQPSAVLRVPMGVVYGAIPVGMLLMLIRLIFNFIEKKGSRPEGSL